MLQNRKFAAISGYFTKFEISKKVFVIGLLTLLAIWNNAKINSELLGTLEKFYLKFDKIAVFHNFLIFYAIPKKFGQICVWFYIPHKNLRYIWGIWVLHTQTPLVPVWGLISTLVYQHLPNFGVNTKFLSIFLNQ